MPRLSALTLIGALCLVDLGTAPAAEYRVELGGDRFRTESLGKSDNRSLRATYYFSGVDDAAGPLTLAPFFAKSSSASIEIWEDRSEGLGFAALGGPISFSNAEEMQGFALAGRYVFDSGWLIGGRLDRADGDPPPSLYSSRDINVDGASVQVGKYLTDKLRVTVAWSSLSTKNEISAFQCLPPFSSTGFCPTPLGFEIDNDELVVDGLFVGNVGGFSYTLSGRVASSRSDLKVLPAPQVSDPSPVSPIPVGFIDVVPVGGIAVASPGPQLGRSKRYSVGGELFPLENLGIRLDYTRWDGDSVVDDRTTLSTTWFVRPSIALGLAVGRERHDLPDPFDDDVDIAEITILTRF